MQVFRFHRNQLNRFDDQHLSLVYDQSAYGAYIQREFSIDAFEDQLGLRREFTGRETLVASLREQYEGIELAGKVKENINAISKDTTFTVTTGHQLSLCTGPLYFVLKILQVIKLSETLNARHPDHYFVPVYWMATEDHDFEEIQSMHIFGKTLTWESDQHGPVGRFSVEGLAEIRAQLKELFQNHPESEIHALIDQYDGKDLAQATRKLVHALFEHFGVVIVDGDDARLKRTFLPVMKKEVTEEFSYHAVTETSAALQREGGKLQVNPREINLFYIERGVRSRIVRNEEGFTVGGIGDFTEADLLQLMEDHPERFSPNVVLRPLYQEIILPNLAYVGGVGEISYWLQLKGVFDAVNCPYPLIAVRNSAMWIDQSVSKRMAKIDLHIEDTFRDVDALKRSYVEENASDELNFDALDQSKDALTERIEQLIMSLDPNLEQYAASETTRLEKQVEGIKGKLIKMAKGKHDDAMKQIEFIIDRLFPNGGLQERSQNFFSFCPDGNYSDKLEQLYNALDVENGDFIVLREF